MDLVARGTELSIGAGMERVIAAPGMLDLERRTAFRRRAEDTIDRLPEGGTLIVDLAATRDVDSAGLGVLIVVQRRAAVRGQTVRLVNVGDELRSLLTLSRLADLFEMESGGHA